LRAAQRLCAWLEERRNPLPRVTKLDLKKEMKQLYTASVTDVAKVSSRQ